MGYLPGAATYTNVTKLVECRRCGARNLAWAKSGRTGRSYLCETMMSNSDRIHHADGVVVCPWRPHKCEDPANQPANVPVNEPATEPVNEPAAYVYLMEFTRMAGTPDEYLWTRIIEDPAKLAETALWINGLDEPKVMRRLTDRCEPHGERAISSDTRGGTPRLLCPACEQEHQDATQAAQATTARTGQQRAESWGRSLGQQRRV